MKNPVFQITTRDMGDWHGTSHRMKLVSILAPNTSMTPDYDDF